MKKIADNRPKKIDNRSLTGSWALSRRHEAMFKRAFREITKNLIDSRFKSIISQGLKNGTSPKQLVGKLPFFDKKNPNTHKFWRQIASKIEKAYSQAVNETIEHELNMRGWKFPITKSKDPKSINDFLRKVALSMAVDLSSKEEKRILGILTRILRGKNRIDKQRAELLIFKHVGITTKQQLMVEARIARAIASGLTESAALLSGQTLSTRLREIRATAIARTETAAAINYALRESWRQAEKQGALPKGTKKKWMRFEDERSSEICEELETHPAIGLNEDFSGGGFTGQGPPAHPNCRSTLVLVFPE